MEHFKLFIGVLSASLITACHKPNPAPEQLDPIYQDLVSQEDKATKLLSEEASKIEELKKTLEKDSNEAVSRSHTQVQIEKGEGKVIQLQQQVEYYHLRSETRKSLDKDTYTNAFNAGKESEWPDSHEIELYQSQARLEKASRRWSDRVPKPSFMGNKSAPIKAKAEAATPE